MSPVSFRRRGVSLPADMVEGMTQIIILQEPATLTEFLGKFAEYMHVIAWVNVKPKPEIMITASDISITNTALSRILIGVPCDMKD